VAKPTAALLNLGTACRPSIVGILTNLRRFLPTAKFACDYMLRSIAPLHCRPYNCRIALCEVTQMHRHLVLAEIIQSYEFAISERTTPCSP
jgi:hypothetical protein